MIRDSSKMKERTCARMKIYFVTNWPTFFYNKTFLIKEAMC